jgi:ankyrin repeat protein
MNFKSILKGACAAWMFTALSLAAFGAQSNDLRLIEAAKMQEKDTVAALLKEKVDVNSHQADGTTALAWAAHWNDLEMADLLIAGGANVNAANEYGVTPLTLAVINRSPAMVEKLLKAKANANAAQTTGETPLMTAASTGNLDVAKLLVTHGAQVNAKEPKHGQTPLMWAIAFQHPDVAKLLIESGADVHAKTYMPTGFKPMMMASYGSDIQVTPKGGYTPLLFAARVGDLDTAKLLIERGADPNEGTEQDGSALVLASAGGHEKLALYLLDKGANPNAKDASGITPLHYAMRDGLKVLHGMDISNIKRVCGAGAGARCTAGSADVSVSGKAAEAVNAADSQVGNYSRKPEGVLAGRNMMDLAKALLAKGADPNAQILEPPPMLRLRHKPTLSVRGATPFFLAAAAGDLSAMKVLVEAHAKPLVSTVINPTEFGKAGFGDDNQIQGNGTPLMVAAGMGRHDDFAPEEEKRALEAVKALVDMGADVNQATETGWTALHAASFGGANSIIEYLASKGAKLNAVNGCGQTPLSLAEGTSARGLLERVTPHKTTGELLRKLGAGSGPAGQPVGKCVEGRFGLEYAVAKPGEKEVPRSDSE